VLTQFVRLIGIPVYHLQILEIGFRIPKGFATAKAPIKSNRINT
jgi:hypothetical protein